MLEINYKMNEDDEDFEEFEEEDEDIGRMSYGYDDDDYENPDSDYEE